MRIGEFKSTYTFAFSLPYIDFEQKEIAQKLLSYGEIPTGDKCSDRAKLRRIELEKAKQEQCISSNRFLTVSVSEQERLQDENKANKNENYTGLEAISSYNKVFIKKFVH